MVSPPIARRLVLMITAFGSLLLAGCPSPLHSDATRQEPESEPKVASAVGKQAGSANNKAASQPSDISPGGIEATQQWIEDAYQSAVDSGSAAAGSVSNWVASDIQARGGWEYRVIRTSLADTEALQSELNDLGSDRWECFSLIADGDVTTLVLKRPRRSVLSSIPLNDLLRIVPPGVLFGGDDPGK